MARPKSFPVRLSDREIEMQQELSAQVGTVNLSEAMRYALTFAHLEIVVKGHQSILKPGQKAVMVPDELVHQVAALIDQHESE